MSDTERKVALVTGSGGMLGADVVDALLASNQYTVFGVERTKRAENERFKSFIGDLTDPAFINTILEESKPALIVNCAAIVNVDACEKDQAAADALHVTATKHLAEYTDATFVYISTDSVFDGQTGGYTEEDEPAPQNYYALSKLRGEQAALEANPNAIIVRTNIYGSNSSQGKSLAEWAIAALTAGETIKGFSDVYFNPLYTKQLARVVTYLAGSDIRGVIHATADHKISKYDFVRTIAEKLGLPADHIQSGKLADQGLTAKRPMNSTLDSAKLAAIYPEPSDLSLEYGLEEFCTDYKLKLAHSS